MEASVGDIDYFHQIYFPLICLLFAYILLVACLCYSGDKKGGVYYFNTETGESTWEHPVDIYYSQVIREAKEKKSRAVTDPPMLQASHTEPQTRKKKVSLKTAGGKAGGDVFKPRPVLGPIGGSSVEVIFLYRHMCEYHLRKELNNLPCKLFHCTHVWATSD